ncbi:hypothetical protein [Arenibacter certesii]|uniref:Uncharacterized protein n=1 Tax=Arenibacter certesii TaxID=228955 RepID=A0A918MMT0_9FLAO|nr:hypothetical protein [Arenibacter certesii]GGW37277.1 hypothetical protein GCM10007383_22670 [Arenibacter certesii]
MIDYVKILIKDADIDRLSDNPLLDFQLKVSEDGGEISNKKKCSYHFCTITIYDSGAVIFYGSIHKMYNSLTGILAPNHKKDKEYKGYNGNQFYWNEILFVKQHLLELFDVEPSQMIFQNIELGVNLTTSFDPQLFIKGLLMFEGKSFDYRYNDYYSQSQHGQYTVKIYNKGNQYNMALNTLRFEMKVTRMEFQRKGVGITTIANLDERHIKRVFLFLKKQLEKVLYYDNTIRKGELSSEERIKCKDYSNPRYWKNLASNLRYRPKLKLHAIIENNSDNVKAELLGQLNKICIKFDQDFESGVCIKFDSSSMGPNIIPQHVKICPVTGLDISIQKSNSKLLSNTSLKHNEKMDPNTFEKLS